MKEIKNTLTTTYDAGQDFRVDITASDNMIEAFIYHKDYGTKELMFGICTTGNAFKQEAKKELEKFFAMVEANVQNYKDYYQAEYMD